MSSKKESFDNLLQNQLFVDNYKDVIDNINSVFSKIDKDDEFEASFFNFNNTYLSFEKYFILLEFIKKRSKAQKLELVSEDTLDIIYTQSDTNDTYRITITGMDNINKYMKILHEWKNHVIFKVLINKIGEGEKNISIMKKIKNRDNNYDINDLNIRLRLSKENSDIPKNELKTLEKLDYTQANKIFFRMKERTSLKLENVIIDLTKARSGRNINNIENSTPSFELEVELNKNTKDALNDMFSEITLLTKIIQQSNFVTTKSMQDNVITEYSRIMALDKTKIFGLNGRQPESLEIQYLTEFLPDKYAVTDKADGDRYFLIIVDNKVYLISTNLNVKYTGIELDKKIGAKYNDTILDGEYIFIAKENRHIFMVFDCLFKGKEDVRKIPEFMTRLKHADEVINECFIFDKQLGYEFKEYKNKNNTFDLNDISNFHKKELETFMSNLNNDIRLEKRFLLVRRKYFIPASGAKSWEIFRYSQLLWQEFTENSKINCPYILDGLIYHPLNQFYETPSSKSKFREYKWKPPMKNSIDFYIQFERDPETNKIIPVYDNSIDEFARNKPYKICNLFVGNKGKDGFEEPVLFREEQNSYKCHLFLENGDVRDLDGKIIADNTVVEFYYNNNPDIDPRFRWVPIRTRYDKTESVQRFRRKYGNFIDSANKVWRSITNPILISDYIDLAKGDSIYQTKMESFRGRIDKELIAATNKENAYYQIRQKIAKAFRNYHNFIKSNIIYTYCNKWYNDNKTHTVLDYACGVGGDVSKFYYVAVSSLVGIDYDKQGLINPVDGAYSRYNELRKKKRNVPPMTFIHADGGALLNVDDQVKALGGLADDDRKLMEKYLNKKNNSNATLFDRVNCQFAIHYFLKNNDTWTNFKQNLNDYLKNNGFFMCTTFDAREIIKMLGDKDTISTYYTNDKGEKKLLWELIKKFDINIKDQKQIGVGNTIDFFAAWMFNEGVYHPEFLVDYNFIVSELEKDCGLELVDSDLFSNQYEYHREFITKYAQFESNQDTRKFLLNVKEFYEKNDINEGCLLNDKITRYYIFKKKDNFKQPNLFEKKEKESKVETTGGSESEVVIKKKTSKSKKQKGGGKFYEDSDEFLIREGGSIFDAIHDALVTHNIVPKSVSSKELFTDLKIIQDKVTPSRIKSIAKNIVIEHQLEGGKKKELLDGLNIHLIDKESNDRIKFGDANKNIILIKDGDKYQTIYKKIKNGIKGLFYDDEIDF